MEQVAAVSLLPADYGRQRLQLGCRHCLRHAAATFARPRHLLNKLDQVLRRAVDRLHQCGVYHIGESRVTPELHQTDHPTLKSSF